MLDLKRLEEIFRSAADANLTVRNDPVPARIVELPDNPGHTVQFIRAINMTDIGSTTSLVEDYCDYENVKEDKFEAHAHSLGAKAASLYSVLRRNAVQKFGAGNTAVTDLWSGLRFNAVWNKAGSITDPACLISGWVSYRLKFSAGKLPE